MPAIKDLVVDMAPFWDKVRAVKPWLQPAGPPPEREYLVPERVDDGPRRGDELHHVRRLRLRLHRARGRQELPRARPRWRRPGASSATRATTHEHARLRELQRAQRHLGLHALQHVRPGLPQGRQADGPDPEAARRGDRTTASRTTTAAATRWPSSTWSSTNGRLDEFRLPVFTEGKFNFIGQLSYLPSAPRMIRSGKMPPLFPHKISGVKHVKRIFKSFERAEAAAECGRW